MSERKRLMKNPESGGKALSTRKDQPSGRKHQRKGEAPVRILPSADLSLEVRHSNSLLVCKNAACQAILSPDDAFCKRCACCICHLFDDNKDTSLWLVCASDSGGQDCCGLSCHLECAFQRERVGVVDQGQLMQLDGGYCCDSCGKVTSILGCWKKQLIIAKDARRADVLCFRIALSCRLLNGTSRFRELHEIMRDAKARLEADVGPLDGISAKTGRGIASRLSSASEVQKLISLAIEKADELLAAASNSNPNFSEGSLPAACRFHFVEVTSSSVVIVLTDSPAASSEDIKGYKLWYCKCRDETHPKEPISSFSRSQRRILISNLQPCTEYSFRIVSYSDAGNIGHSEAKCFTRSVEVMHRNSISGSVKDTNEDSLSQERLDSEGGPKITTPAGSSSSGFKVRDLGMVLQLAWAHDNEASGSKSTTRPEIPEKQHPTLGLDLNIASVPDLDDELIPTFGSYRDEDNVPTSGPAVDADAAAATASHEIGKNLVARSHGSGNSQNFSNGLSREVAAVDSRRSLDLKRALSPNEATPRDSSRNGPQARALNGSGSADDFEYCVKTIRWLECEGHINPEFRLKMLTWFSTRATAEERRVVGTFIHTLVDDPSSLAAQLFDSFSDTIFRKNPRNGAV